MNIFKTTESEVRSYCRSFPVVFERSEGDWLYDDQGNAYLDFLSDVSVCETNRGT
ncbi:MAG: hypothetical protein WBI84_07355 [Burkholderiaceae bacterium]